MTKCMIWLFLSYLYNHIQESLNVRIVKFHWLQGSASYAILLDLTHRTKIRIRFP